MTNNTIITIGRQYGSGGREIGEKLAQRLGFKYYDKEIITMAAKKSGLNHELLHDIDEKPTSSLLYTIALGTSAYNARGNFLGHYEMPLNDKLFIVQADVIREIAAEGPCVIVGRCADYILREEKNRIALFIHNDFEKRSARIAEEFGISAEKAGDMVIKTDKKRAGYYNYYTGQKWSSPENYDLSINSGKLGIDGTVELISSYISIFNK